VGAAGPLAEGCAQLSLLFLLLLLLLPVLLLVLILVVTENEQQDQGLNEGWGWSQGGGKGGRRVEGGVEEGVGVELEGMQAHTVICKVLLK
jgi:hypothetical protein